ncbi:MAG: hemolysin family protein [Actinomycetota bacterium]|nr:hemolysin family protein [Actinomycetota bacterium]
MSPVIVAAAATSTDWLLLFVIFVLLLVLAFLAIAEMGLSRMSKPRANSLSESGGSGRSLARLVDEPEHWINPLLLTVNVCQTVQATLTGIVAGRLFGAWGVVIGVALNVIVFFVLAEAVPKTYAVLHSDRAALIAAKPVRALVAFPPLQAISRGLIGLTNVIVRGKGLKKGPFVSEQELLGILQAAAADEVIEHEERQLIESIIEFGDTVAREIMVPRPDMVMIPATATVSTALDLSIANGYSRMPIADPEGDDIVGLAYAKDLIGAERNGRGGQEVAALARPVHFIPENKPVSALMREMQAAHFHLAVVADEYGAITGLITLEDCLEELVGEIVDEYDDEQAAVEQVGEREWLVSGALAISELNEHLEVHIPHDDWDTLGGFVFGTLGHVPEPGEQVEHDGYEFVTVEVEGRRIRKVRVIAPEPVVADDEPVLAHTPEHAEGDRR